MKKVKFTVSQINEALNVSVDVQNNDVANSIKKAKAETDKAVGSSVDRNYVISGDELNEEDINDNDIFIKCVDDLLDDIDNDPDLEEIYVNPFGGYNMNEVMDALAEYYTDLTDKILYNDRNAYKAMKKCFIEKANERLYEGLKSFSKKQIEESKKNKNFKVLTKKEIEKKFNKNEK